MQMKFYYYLDLMGILRLLPVSRRQGCELFYFNISSPAKIFLKISGLTESIRRYNFILSDIRDEKGESYLPEIESVQLVTLCNRIIDELIRESSLFRSMGRVFSQEHLLMYFRKTIEEEIRDIVIFLNVIRWHKCRSNGSQPGETTFCMPRSPYLEIIGKFALEEFGIKVFSCFSFKRINGFLYHLARNLAKLLACFFLPFRPKNILSLFKKKNKDNLPKLAVSYVGLGITFEAVERCESSWLLKGNIPNEQLLICFRRKDIPISEKELSLLSERGIGYLSFIYGKEIAKYMEVYFPGFVAARLLLRLGIRITSVFIRECFRLRVRSLIYINKLFDFAFNYARAYDFYLSHNIRMTVDYDVYNLSRVAEHLALADLGGISICYQRSHWAFSGVYIGSCADIMFLFGPSYREPLINGGTYNKYILHSGYLTDYAFTAVRGRAEQLRNKLADKGAKFIISYFDENSSDDRMSILPNATSAHIYQKLIDWVLRDETMGLICSPKKPTTLFKRMPQIKGLVDKAKRTGRCVFMESRYVSLSHPAEPAQASDLAITLLVGGTVGMESYLSGARTVYLDLEGFRSLPEYKWGQNAVVFDNVDTLIDAVKKERNNGRHIDQVRASKMTSLMKQRDPFQDGRAAERMGTYINWLLGKLSEGAQPEEAVVLVNEKYSAIWGKENIH